MHINRKFSSPNFSDRLEKIEYIIVHFTEMAFDDALLRLTNPSAKVSAHYLIKEDGEVYNLVDDSKVAWHAGFSCWNKKIAMNERSIGIELDNLGNDVFTDAQMESCINLSKFLCKKYDISSKNFIGHSDVAPDRKIDPGLFFDWELCYKSGLGVWYDSASVQNSIKIFEFNSIGEGVALLQKNLSKLGYNINVTGVFDLQTNFVIRAFQSKFYQSKLIESGLGFYRNNSSKYIWDSCSESILQKLLE